MSESPEIVFITGSGRSGTNILKKILSQHKDVASLPFESRFMVDPKGVLDFYNTFPSIWSPYWADAKIKELETFLLSLAELSDEKKRKTQKAKEIDPTGLKITPPSYSGWELNHSIPDYSQFVEALIRELTDFKYSALWPGSAEDVPSNKMYFSSIKSKEEISKPLSGFITKTFHAIIKNQQKSILVDDNTHSILFAADLLDLVPSSKLIHIVRDPRDVISSLKTQRWAPKELSQTITWYLNVMNQWENQRMKLDGNRYIEVKFETMIEKPLVELEAMMAFCGMKERSLDLEVNLKNHNIGRHEKQLSLTEIEEINDRCGEIIDRYGY